MNFKFYLEKLHASEVFKKFAKENPSAFLCSCFFSIDFAGDDNKAHLDYFIPETKQMFGFQLEKNCEKIPIEFREGFFPEKLNEKINLELKDVEKVLFNRMKEDKIQEKVQKVFISLQRANKKDMIVGTIFISAMGMITFEMEPVSKKIISFNKKSFLDFFRILKK